MTDRMTGVASVSYLNARPLIWGLERDPKVRLELAVPSKLIDLLQNGNCDVALLPTIDFQRMPNLAIVPSGGIGSDGATLTVRIFSRQPIEKISTLACDRDSHTSVALARIILAERYGIRPEFAESDRAADAKLLIGDKVVTDEPRDCKYQYDLGAEWKTLTGMPFVFAVWTARQGIDLGDLPQRLTEARIEGFKHIDELIERFAIPRGWPGALARQYLTSNLKFEVSEPQIRAIEHFHALAAKHGIIETPRPLAIY